MRGFLSQLQFHNQPAAQSYMNMTCFLAVQNLLHLNTLKLLSIYIVSTTAGRVKNKTCELTFFLPALYYYV